MSLSFVIKQLEVKTCNFLIKEFNSYKPGIVFLDIGKQNSPRWDAADCGIPSGAVLFALKNFSEKWIKNYKIAPHSPKNGSVLDYSFK